MTIMMKSLFYLLLDFELSELNDDFFFCAHVYDFG